MINSHKAWSNEDVTNFKLFILGDEKGFTHLHRKLYKSFLNFAYRLLDDNIDVDCIVQDAFLFAWQRRDQIKDLKHFYLSIRLHVRMSCFRYWNYNQKRKLLYLNYYNIERVSCNDWECESPDRDDLQHNEELLELLERAIPYLQVTTSDMIKLYQKGLSFKKIAKLFDISYQRVVYEIKTGVLEIRFALPSLKKAYRANQKKRIMPVANYEAYLTEQQAKICTLYYKNNMAFSSISKELNLAPFDLLKEHYTAMNILNRVTKKANYIILKVSP